MDEQRRMQAINADLLAALEGITAQVAETEKTILQISAVMGNPAMADLLPFGMREQVDKLAFGGIDNTLTQARAAIARARDISEEDELERARR